jgi:hypothetical protein
MAIAAISSASASVPAKVDDSQASAAQQPQPPQQVHRHHGGHHHGGGAKPAAAAPNANSITSLASTNVVDLTA